MVRCVVLVLVVQAVAGQVVYDTYFGRPLGNSRRDQLNSRNAVGSCTIPVEPCRKEEHRRIDGTCVNPKYPSRGGSGTPLLRMLPPKYGQGNSLRPALNGSSLPSARRLSTTLLQVGYSVDLQFTILASNLFMFSVMDSIDFSFMLNLFQSDCCVGNSPSITNPSCIPIEVPADDPYMRRSGFRCMNFTRVPSFQDRGCIPSTLPAERYNLPTPLIDLSVVYGFSIQREREIRLFAGGLLRFEQRNGGEYPPGNSSVCVQNRRPVENACYEFGDEFGGNVFSGVTLTTLWFYREHNRIARALAKINPCWDDQKLYETARTINIAQWQYILYYELLSVFLGKENALQAGVIYDTKGFVDDFDEKYKPGVFHEYTIGTQWFNTLQDGRTDLYDNKGRYISSRNTVEDHLRSGIWEVGSNEADITQGTFRQPSGKMDHTMDPDIAVRFFGNLQIAADLPAMDIMRGRDVGLSSYNDYRRVCGLPVAHDWEDLKDTIKENKIEDLKRTYSDVNDLELMVAIYLEKWLPGSRTGPVLFCIMAQNLVQWRRSDKYFFEHGNMHASLSLPQLHEIRKSSAARLMCDNGLQVDRIQPRALHMISKENQISPCKEIPGVNLHEWEDQTCKPNKGKPKHSESNGVDNWKPIEGWEQQINYGK